MSGKSVLQRGGESMWEGRRSREIIEISPPQHSTEEISDRHRRCKLIHLTAMALGAKNSQSWKGKAWVTEHKSITHTQRLWGRQVAFWVEGIAKISFLNFFIYVACFSTIEDKDHGCEDVSSSRLTKTKKGLPFPLEEWKCIPGILWADQESWGS